jgi:hypothetical protein
VYVLVIGEKIGGGIIQIATSSMPIKDDIRDSGKPLSITKNPADASLATALAI